MMSELQPNKIANLAGIVYCSATKSYLLLRGSDIESTSQCLISKYCLLHTFNVLLVLAQMERTDTEHGKLIKLDSY